MKNQTLNEMTFEQKTREQDVRRDKETKNSAGQDKSPTVVPPGSSQTDIDNDTSAPTTVNRSDDDEDAYFERIMAIQSDPTLTHEDDLFLQYVENTPPIPPKRTKGVLPTSQRPSELPDPPEDALFVEAMSNPAPVERPYRRDASSIHRRDTRSENFTLRQIYSQLRAEKRSVDAKIDLHSKTLEQAKRELQTHIPYMRRKGHRVVLVITGKGQRDEPVGVLRKEIPVWLRESLPDHVETIIGAPRNLGGDGAQIVVLRPFSRSQAVEDSTK